MPRRLGTRSHWCVVVGEPGGEGEADKFEGFNVQSAYKGPGDLSWRQSSAKVERITCGEGATERGMSCSCRVTSRHVIILNCDSNCRRRYRPDDGDVPDEADAREIGKIIPCDAYLPGDNVRRPCGDPECKEHCSWSTDTGDAGEKPRRLVIENITTTLISFEI